MLCIFGFGGKKWPSNTRTVLIQIYLSIKNEREVWKLHQNILMNSCSDWKHIYIFKSFWKKSAEEKQRRKVIWYKSLFSVKGLTEFTSLIWNTINENSLWTMGFSLNVLFVWNLHLYLHCQDSEKKDEIKDDLNMSKSSQ